MKRVLFLIESLSGGGAEKVLVTLLNHIDKTKFDVTLCTVVDTGPHKASLNKNIKYTSIIKPQSSIIGKLWYKIKYKLVYRILPMQIVYLLFVPKNNDVEIAFVEGFATRLLTYSNNNRAKKIAWVHTDLINNHWIGPAYSGPKDELYSYSRYDIIVGVSNTVRDSIINLYKLPNVITLYNPIDSDYIRAASNTESDRIRAEGRIKLVTTGRLVPQKGYDRLLRIIKSLVRDSFDIELTILGEGPERAKLQAYIDENKLGDRVFMPGFVQNPYRTISESSLFVCSSRSEGYSTAVTEAIILGIPVITTRCSGMDEILDNGKYGIITENSEDQLYNICKVVLSHPEMLDYYKKCARKRSDYFSIDKLVNAIEELLAR